MLLVNQWFMEIILLMQILLLLMYMNGLEKKGFTKKLLQLVIETFKMQMILKNLK